MRCLASALIGLLVTACGLEEPSSELASMLPIETHEAILSDLVVERAPGGFTGDEFVITIKGTVQVGENPCRAAGKSAELDAVRQGTTLTMRAVVKDLSPGDRMCTEEYLPVYKEVAVTWKGSRHDTHEIILQHVAKLNETLTIEP